MLKPFSVLVVQASDVFFGKSQAWDAFQNSEPPCSWGDNNRTLISKEFLLDSLGNIDDEDDAQEEITAVKAVVESLADDVYIDLEN